MSGLGSSHAYMYGCRTVEILTSVSHNAQTIILHDVLYVPDAQDNLLSISHIDYVRGQVHFTHGQVFLLEKNGQLAAKANLINQLYIKLLCESRPNGTSQYYLSFTK